MVTIIDIFLQKKIACIVWKKKSSNNMVSRESFFKEKPWRKDVLKIEKALSMFIASLIMYLFFKCLWWDMLLTNMLQEWESLLRVSKINRRSTWWPIGLLQKKGIILPLIVCHIIRFSESVNQSCIPNWIRNLGFGGEC